MKKIFVLSMIACAVMLAGCQEKKTEQAAKVASETTKTETQSNQPSQAVDLSEEINTYRTWLESEIDELVVGVEKFATVLKSGNVAEAKALYPEVRVYFERSEPIAGSFGDLDPRIDNREADLEAGEVWTGFHAIEKILWTQNTTAGTEKLAEQLLADAKQLREQVSQMPITGELMVQGSVDLLNEVSTGKITGEEEIFSKTDLYDFQANIEGAEKIFEILTPKLKAKDEKLVATIEERFADVYKELAKYREGGVYKPYDTLTSEQTKSLAEAVNKLGEPLAQMGIILE